MRVSHNARVPSAPPFDDAHDADEALMLRYAKGDMAATLTDARVLISIALQWGVSVDDLAKSLGSVPTWVNGALYPAPASPIGTIIAEIRKASI